MVGFWCLGVRERKREGKEAVSSLQVVFHN